MQTDGPRKFVIITLPGVKSLITVVFTFSVGCG